jgi:hypothetical protein
VRLVGRVNRGDLLEIAWVDGHDGFRCNDEIGCEVTEPIEFVRKLRGLVWANANADDFLSANADLRAGWKDGRQFAARSGAARVDERVPSGCGIL